MMSRAFIAAAALACIGVQPAQAQVDENLADPVAVNEAIAKMPIGAPLKLIEKHIADRLEGMYKPAIKQSGDPLERDRLKRELPEKIKQIHGTWQELKGDTTGYEVSILTGEYRINDGDALLRELRDGQDWYYLFHNGKLWKVVATLAPRYDLGTAALRLTTSLGVPKEIELPTDKIGGPVARATWETGDTVIELSDRRSDYACYTLIWGDKALWKAREADRKRLGTGFMNPLMDKITDDHQSDEVNDIVDEILGPGK
jgi:hypothetical protein